MVKRYAPAFDAEDLTKLPNYQSVVVAQIQGVPSAPFSMNWIPPMGQANQQLSDALKRLSSAKYGRPRGQVEQEIFARLTVKKEQPVPGAPVGLSGSRPAVGASSTSTPATSGSSFLDEWLAKRKQMGGGQGGQKQAPMAQFPTVAPPTAPKWPVPPQNVSQPSGRLETQVEPKTIQAQISDELSGKENVAQDDSHLSAHDNKPGEVSIKLR